ncbi:hypothetical protein ACLOJK_009906 [Asimina triloba]
MGSFPLAVRIVVGSPDLSKMGFPLSAAVIGWPEMAILQCRKRGGFSINGNLRVLISDGRACRSDAVTAGEWSTGHGEVVGWVRSMVGWSSVDGCTAAAMPAKGGTRLRKMMHFGTVLWQPARVRAHAAHVCDPSRSPY